ncbi:hypothetical protein HML84_17835 [Alcanivorax sp. IO_7]|nr:hypothetical protein HML84_17835 [Alcanivorax sp. IO_7]
MVISANEALDVIQRSIQFGADGFIPKSASVDDMTHALSRIIEGNAGCRITRAGRCRRSPATSPACASASPALRHSSSGSWACSWKACRTR